MKQLLAGLAALAAAVLVAPAAAAGQEAAEISLVHGVPGVPVDVVVDGAVAIAGFEPGTVQDISGLAGQTLTNLEARAAGTSDVVIGPIASFDVPASGSHSVVAHLDADGNPTITTFTNNAAPIGGGLGRLTIRHAAAAPAVDLVVGDARPVQAAENGDSVDLDLIAGELSGVQLAPAGGDPIADVPPLMLQEGTNLIVYVVGSLDDGTLTFYTEERDLLMGAGGSNGTEEGGTSDAAAEGGAGEATGEGGMDATPAPTAVNTGSPLTPSSNALVYLVGAAFLGAVAAGALTLRRRASGGGAA
jgi:hypothetical protein